VVLKELILSKVKQRLLMGHLGLGDHLICNALVRYLAESAPIVVLAKRHNVSSCTFMWRDKVAISVFPVSHDEDALAAVEVAERSGFEIIRLGGYRDSEYDRSAWDKEFYRHAGLAFERRWSGFKVDRRISSELMVVDAPGGAVDLVPFDPNRRWTTRPYVFVHDDSSRGFNIDPQRLPHKLPVVRPRPLHGLQSNIFDWLGVLMNAEEIHCINSSFAILADHAPSLAASRRVMHAYAREGVLPASRMEWEVLK